MPIVENEVPSHNSQPGGMLSLAYAIIVPTGALITLS